MEYINVHRDRMVLGAALLEDDDDLRVGMMIAVDLPDRQAVEAFMRKSLTTPPGSSRAW